MYTELAKNTGIDIYINIIDIYIILSNLFHSI